MERNILATLPLSSFKIFNIHDIRHAKRKNKKEESRESIMKLGTDGADKEC